MDVTKVNDSGGVEPTYTTIAAGESETFENDKNTIIHIKETGGEAADVTIPTPVSFDGDLEVDDRIIAVEADDEIFAGPFRSIYEDDDGEITIELEDTSGAEIEVAALKV